MLRSFVFRSRSGRIMTVLIAVLCAGGLIASAASAGIVDTLRILPALLLIALLGWMLFWRPVVEADDAGVRLVNVLRTIELSWPEIQRIDTKWALAFQTSHGVVTAWAAPAPGRHAVYAATRQDGVHLPESTYVDGTVRPGDLVTSDSGHAAYLIRLRWEELRDAGLLGESEYPRLRVHWQWPLIATALALTALTVLATIL